MDPSRLASREDVFHARGRTIQEVLFLGLVVNYLLWGVQITQSYHYYRSYRKTDTLWVKGVVALLFITEAVHTICTSAGGWSFLVNNPDPSLPQYSGWGGNAIPFMNAVTASIVHIFYAHKIWILLNPPHNYIATAVVLVLSCLQLAGGVGCSALMFSINITFPEFLRVRKWACIWLVTAAATDIIIAALLTWKLNSSRSGIKVTDDLISKLIRLIVETGLATAAVQLADIVIYLIWPLEAYHLVFAFIDPKVYSNSVLALLNSRRSRTSTSSNWNSRLDNVV